LIYKTSFHDAHSGDVFKGDLTSNQEYMSRVIRVEEKDEISAIPADIKGLSRISHMMTAEAGKAIRKAGLRK
jgi:hypothetical protein